MRNAGGLFAVSAQAPNYAALLAAPDRSPADHQADHRRDPLPFLVFAGVRPGMKVLDMGAGGGYSTELMARAVAPGGIVYGQNPPDLGEKARAAFAARLQTPAMKDAVADVRPFDDPTPPGVPLREAEAEAIVGRTDGVGLAFLLMTISAGPFGAGIFNHVPNPNSAPAF